MRICDWSSDVCSSDLAPQPALGGVVDRHQHRDQRLIYERFQDLCSSLIPRQPRRIVELQPHRIIRRILRDRDPLHLTEEKIAISARATYQGPHNSSEEETHLRSEEHTSELQTLTRH